MNAKAILLSDEAAFRLREDTTNVEDVLLDLSENIDDLHDQYPYHDLGASVIVAARARWRTSMASIVYDAEIELRDEINQRLCGGLSLAPIEHQRQDRFDYLFHQYGTFGDAPLAFLRAMSALSQPAMNRVIDRYRHDEGSRQSQLVWSFEENDMIIGRHFRAKGGHFPMLKPAIERLREFSVTANVTALNIIAPAAEYTRLWTPSGSASVSAAMLDNIESLSLPQYATGALHEKHIPNYNQAYVPPNASPFSSTAEQFALHGIWRLPSLRKPWRYKRWCPATIVFDPLLSTAGTMRIEAAAKVADGVLWASGR